jgi:glycosyltransferase involved in cell wall biosynthesis
MPLISVIIPVFNGEKTIKETINSVLEQTFSDFEIIVIDDGSKDSTVNVLESISDSRLKVFSYPNGGVSVSRDRGLSHASGDFIAFLDADDLWTPDKLEAQFNALQANPQAAVAYSWVNYITQSGEFFRLGNHVNANGDVYERMLIQNLVENGSNFLIRRQALIEVGGFNPALTPAEDWDMGLRLAARYHFVVVPAVQILYRMSSSSGSANVLRMESASVKVIEEAFKQAPPSLQHLKRRSLATLYHYLTFKTIEVAFKQQDGLVAARFFWNATINDLFVLRQPKTILTAMFKIAAVVSLPPQQSRSLITTTKQMLMKWNYL